MDKDIKDIIKIPKELDDAILKGFEKGKKEKRKYKNKLIFKRASIAAMVIIVFTATIGVVNPKFVSAIPLIGDIFEYYNDGRYKQSSNTYKELGKEVNLTVEDKDVKVTLNKVVVDDNMVMASLMVESDKLNGYDDKKNPQDFVDTTFDIFIDGEVPSSYKEKVTIINETTAAIILEVNVSDLDLGKEVKINIDIANFTRGKKTIAKGKWDFNIKAIKGSESTTYEVNKGIKLANLSVNLEKLVLTPLTNRLYFKGNAICDKDNWLGDNDFIIRDQNGRVLTYEFVSGYSDMETNYEYTFDILNDLSEIDYIEIVKAGGNKTISTEINGFNYNLLKASVIDESNVKREHEIISREPTKEEINDGYALEKVIYNLDIDRNNAFESINSLIGKEIAVNNTAKIIINNIISYDDYTEVVMKIEGNYDYRLLSNTVLFDEEMNDACAFEGSTTQLNDIEEKIVTVKLSKIDPLKKYTIVIPVTTDLVLDENEKIRINLK